MQHIIRKIGIEDLRSRVPGLFAYIEDDGNGNMVLHHSYDAVDGCYGKIIENIKLPCDAELCIYERVDTDNAPSGYWESSEDLTLLMADADPVSASSTSPKYVRRISSYSYVLNKEVSDTSEYVEVDFIPVRPDDESEDHVYTIATDKYGRTLDGCYSYYDKVPSYTYYERECVLSGGATYSYRTLMWHYYRHKDSVGTSNPFVAFIMRGIGLIEVDFDLVGVNQDDCPLAPSSIYYAEVEDLYASYLSMHETCKDTAFVASNEAVCCMCEKYEKMGGDRFMIYLKSLRDDAVRLSDEFYCHAENRDSDASICLDVNLRQGYNDSGFLTSYVNEFVPGYPAYDGDIVTYNGKSYICQLDRVYFGSDSGHTYRYIKKSGVCYKLIGSGYVQIYVASVEAQTLPMSMYNSSEFICYRGKYYAWNFTDSAYEQIDIKDSTTGVWNSTTRKMEFDPYHLIPVTEYVKSNFTTSDEAEGWYSEENVYGDRYKLFYDSDNVPDSYIYDTVRVGTMFYTWDESTGAYVANPDAESTYTVSGKTDSKLTSIRSYRSYMNSGGYTEYPGDGEDWLYYYDLFTVTGFSAIKDDIGNIERWGTTNISVGDTVSDLYAYGNIITSITYDSSARTITFEYAIGAHLLAKCDNIVTDEDNKIHYLYTEFYYDPSDTHGIVYTETYRYDAGSELEELIANDASLNHFEYFINGEYDSIVDANGNKVYDLWYSYYKFAFATYPLGRRVSSRFGLRNVTYTTIQSEYSEEVSNSMDCMYAPLIKRDYFVGITHDPRIDNKVRILRGDSQSFERRLRLGEVKTMEDMESEQNGSFFIFSEN